MKTIFLLVTRYLRQQGKRSALTVLGILLAVALLTAVGVMAASMRQTMLDQTIAQTAHYHTMVSGVTPAQAAAWAESPEVAAAGLASALGIHHLDNVFISIESYDAATREIFGLQLANGRFPQAPGEIALEAWIFDYLEMPRQTGQTIQLPFQQSYRDPQGVLQSYQGTAEFTVVGVLQNTGGKVAGASLGLVSLETVTQLLPPDAVEYRGFVRIAPGYAPRDTISALAARAGLATEQLRHNEPLLRALEEGNALNWPVVLLGLIVVVATVATIYNAFHIAVLERMRQFGLLRALGATRRQIHLLVVGEGLLLASFAVPAGLLLGVAAAAGLAQLIAMVDVLVAQLVIPGAVLLGAGGLGLVATLVSASLPALLAGRISPLQAINGRRRVLPGANPSKRTRLTRHLGITARMAYQNLWRNRRRSLVTVFSLGLGVILFLSFTAWAASTDEATIARGMLNGDYALLAQGGQRDAGFSPEAAQAAAEIEGVTSVQHLQADYGVALLLSTSTLDPEIRDMFPPDPALAADMRWLPSLFLGYGEPELAAAAPYLRDGGIDGALVYDFHQSGALQVGDEIVARKTFHEDGEAIRREQTFTITGIVDDLPLKPAAYPVGGPVIVLPQARYRAFTADLGYKRLDVTLSDDADAAAVAEQLQALADSAPQGTLLSFAEETAKLEAQKQELMMMAYALVSIITIIAAVNIVNTITTNLILRTREFGMLRAVGITGRQLRRMTWLEGAFYGLLSAAWSIPLGLGLAYLLYLLLRREMTYLQWSAPWTAVLLAGLACVLIGVAATILPMRRLSRLEVVAALRTIT
jgi:putative ABC transport system permease protein